MKINGWNVMARKGRSEIRCQRDSRTVFIPLDSGEPVLNWRDGFGALTPQGLITWMNPKHSEVIISAVREGRA